MNMKITELEVADTEKTNPGIAYDKLLHFGKSNELQRRN